MRALGAVSRLSRDVARRTAGVGEMTLALRCGCIAGNLFCGRPEHALTVEAAIPNADQIG